MSAADVNYAWPTAQIAVMGAKGAVEIIFRQDIGDPDKIAERTREYEERFLSPFVAAERGYIDEVIMPPRHPPARRPGARHAARQEGREALAQARQHPSIIQAFDKTHVLGNAMADTGTETLEVRLDRAQVDEVDAVAREMESDRAAVIGEAIDAFLEQRRWEMEHIREGLRQADAEEFASDEDVARVFRRPKA